MTGALHGLKVLEFGSIGPAPFGVMMLADHGADVVRVDRRGAFASVTPAGDAREELLHRNRRSIALDLKTDEDRETARRLAGAADVLVEGNRPGVMERLGLGPEVLMADNPRLVYARMTGWGQTGPYAGRVGHDINYLSISGTLSLIGAKGAPPTIPLALLGDFGGGGTFLAFGIMAALWERERSGSGQVIDASILGGATLLATAFHGYRQTGGWSSDREDNLVDGGAPFYAVYETADRQWISVGALEPAFYAELLAVLGVDPATVPAQDDRQSWFALKKRFAAIVALRTRDEWVAAAEGTNACLTPVLTLEEARADPQVVARGGFEQEGGLHQPAPAPLLGRTPAARRTLPPRPGEHAADILTDWLG
ncbi:carnitine dehydratase [Subtercola boreus]|uniref:Carnitine dehydratase n=1 Tax=Subtercola boreus TaxID=120213 RepID=A0A3E0VLE6_9MICO|nr:CaiB/BaiF CoA-transferase family protein [Subtercola boreus]RFA10465.1 carnitine dehydratase [Subtercola boreus]TQL56004.1 alpha-methylacyl-CoA racemase [Subtercola boreus]